MKLHEGQPWILPRISDEEVQRRHRRLREEMAKRQISCLVVAGSQVNYGAGSDNVRYLSNYGIFYGEGYIVFPLSGEARMFCRSVNQEFNARSVSCIQTQVSGYPVFARDVANYIKESKTDGGAAPYTLRMGYDNGGDQGVGPGTGGDASAAAVISKFVDGSGTYAVTWLDHRDRIIFNYQNANNYYFMEVQDGGNWVQSEGGTENGVSIPGYWANNKSCFQIGMLVNGHRYIFGSSGDGVNWPGLGGGGKVELSFTWDATANTIAGTLNSWNALGAPLVSNGTFSATDPDYFGWNSGKVGFQSSAYNNTYTDFASFEVLVPEPATMTMLVLGGIGALLRRRK